ncbi:serine/threonine-protein kinase [Kitasatospora sp. NPDC094028]
MRSGLHLAGRYLLQEPLGRGGMGEVWLGRDDRLHRPVAVKILPLAAEAERDAVTRFRREAKIAANLNHPGITTVFDIDEHVEETGRTLVFLVMELLQGHDLHAEIARHPGGLPIERATEFGRQILEALGAAHEQGVTHRDIKPANLFLLAKGRVKVCDFGIARLADATRISSTGSIAGTPLYMAPEQIQGGLTDQRTDLYAFGCVLYELLTGTSWVDTGSGVAALLYQHLSRLPDAPSTRRPEIPGHLDRLVLDLLAKDPADRPPTAAAALALLEGPGLAGTGPDATVPLRGGQAPVDASPEDPAPPSADPAPPSADPTPPPPTAPATTADASPPRRQPRWSTVLLAGALALAVTGAIAYEVNLSNTSYPDVNSPHKDETPSGTVLAQGDTARIPFIYDTGPGTGRATWERITLGVAVTSITRDPTPNAPAGFDSYCVHYRLTNVGSKDMPAQLPIDGYGTSSTSPADRFGGGLLSLVSDQNVQGRPALLLEGVLSDGRLTSEEHASGPHPPTAAVESPGCRPHAPGKLAPGQSGDQGTTVHVPTGSTLTGARWTEPTTVIDQDRHTYTVQWNASPK